MEILCGSLLLTFVMSAVFFGAAAVLLLPAMVRGDAVVDVRVVDDSLLVASLASLSTDGLVGVTREVAGTRGFSAAELAPVDVVVVEVRAEIGALWLNGLKLVNSYAYEAHNPSTLTVWWWSISMWS